MADEAWRRGHLQTRVDRQAVTKDSIRAQLGRARDARLAGDASRGRALAASAGRERSIAFAHGIQTATIAADYGMQVPRPSADPYKTIGAVRPAGLPAAATPLAATVGATPENKARGRRSWMPGKGLR